jgi:hypothetical protein
VASALPSRRNALSHGSLASPCAPRWSYHGALDRIPPAYQPHHSNGRYSTKCTQPRCINGPLRNAPKAVADVFWVARLTELYRWNGGTNEYTDH